MHCSHTTINNKMKELCFLKIINKNLVIGGRLPLIGLSRPVFIFRNSLINSISNFKFFVLLKQKEREREREREQREKLFLSSFLLLSIKAPGFSSSLAFKENHHGFEIIRVTESQKRTLT